MWMYLSMFVMFSSMSGTMYIFLRGVPPFYIGPAGIYLIHPGGKQQFGFEGWAMGASYFVGASAILFFLRGFRQLRMGEIRAEVLRIIPIILTFSFFVPFLVFSRKNPWYGPV